MRTFYTMESEILDLVNGFNNQSLPLARWTHEAHLTVALWHLQHHTPDEALCLLRSGIIVYNNQTGGENSPVKGYHETITVFWLKVIEHYLKRINTTDLLSICNEFLNSDFASKDLPLKFYSKELLFSTQARAFLTEPDKNGEVEMAVSTR